MVRYIFPFILLFLSSCFIFRTEPEEQLVVSDLPIQESEDVCINHIKNDSTWFPEAVDDFQPKGYQAKAVFPGENQISRVWVKGSAKFDAVQIRSMNGEAITSSINLKEPYYTDFIEINNPFQYVSAVFSGVTTKGIIDSISVINTDIYRMDKDPFSVLFYGCFEPFDVDSNMTPIVLIAEHDPLNFKMRNFFSDVALQQQFKYDIYDQEQEVAGSAEKILIEKPVAIIGTGDQIYMDAGYSEKNLKDHPLSAWAHICNNPYPLLSIDKYIEHLDKCYRNFYAFDPIEKALKNIPSFNVWDDHEIRDGWGSHGDEYIKGELNPELAPYFMASRIAYLEHQWNIGPKSKNILQDTTASLHLNFNIKGVPVFAFDLRTNRNILENRVISDEQMSAFKKWCDKLNADQEVIIITSIPLFANTAGEKLVVQTNKEMLDDVHDSWEYNKAQRDTIIKELIRLRERNIKTISIAGDLHYGSVTEVWYEKDDVRKILAYEVITSGLNHITLGDHGGIASGLKDKREEPEWNSKQTRINAFGQDIQYFPSIRFSAVKLNFSALEFYNDSTFINVFVTGDDENAPFEQRRLKINWDKSYEQEKDERTHTLMQILRSSYTPPPIPYYRININ